MLQHTVNASKVASQLPSQAPVVNRHSIVLSIIRSSLQVLHELRQMSTAPSAFLSILNEPWDVDGAVGVVGADASEPSRSPSARLVQSCSSMSWKSKRIVFCGLEDVPIC